MGQGGGAGGPSQRCLPGECLNYLPVTLFVWCFFCCFLVTTDVVVPVDVIIFVVVVVAAGAVVVLAQVLLACWC